MPLAHSCHFFFFNDTATTEIYTLSLTRRSSDLKVNKRSQVFIGARNQAFTIAVPTSNEVGSGCFTDCLEPSRSEEHTSELQSQSNLVCRLLLEKKKTVATTVVSWS